MWSKALFAPRPALANVPRAAREINGGQYQKTEKSEPSIAIREPRGVTRQTSDVDIETRGFSAKQRPYVSERVFRPPREPGTPRVLRIVVSREHYIYIRLVPPPSSDTVIVVPSTASVFLATQDLHFRRQTIVSRTCSILRAPVFSSETRVARPSNGAPVCL